MGINFSVNKNIITEVETPFIDVGTFLRFDPIVKDTPLRTIYSLNYAGLDRNGAPQFIDENNNITDTGTTIDNVDALINEGTTLPVYYGSLINTLTYKGFSLRALAIFKAGHVFRHPYQFLGVASVDNTFQDFAQRWRQRGDENHTDVPALANIDNMFSFGYGNYQSANKFFDSAAFIRLREVILSYSFPDELLDTLFIQRLKVGLQARNLKVWNFNKWDVDPENILIPLRPTYTINVSVTF